MDLSVLLDKTLILTELKVKTKKDLFLHLFEVAKKTGKITDFEVFKKTVFTREEIQTTGIGRGLAIPHAATTAVNELFVIVGICPEGIEYQAIDDEPCFCVFMIGSPKDDNREYLHILATISRLFRQQDIIKDLIACHTSDDVFEELQRRLKSCQV